MKAIFLSNQYIHETIEILTLRIKDRFPDSGLLQVCQNLEELSAKSQKTIDKISKTNYFFRVIVLLFLLGLFAVILYSISQLALSMNRDSLNNITITDFIQATQAATSEILLLGAGVYSLITFENRQKRKRIVNAINQLKSISHIIDAHQLTKDPQGVAMVSCPTRNSPKRSLTAYELCRYLDYCSEMLSLVSKLGFLYIQHFDDATANALVNELDSINNAMSNKIWQKISMIELTQKP